MTERSVIDDLFGDLFGGKNPFSWTTTRTLERAESQGTGLRSYHSDSDDKGMTLTVDLPGVDPKTVSLQAGGDKLVVTGKNRGKDFTQRYTISSDFDVRTAKAMLRHGQLEIQLARVGESESMRSIPIELG